jgi:hypothetical protein
MSQDTGLNSDDIVSTLQFYSLLKYWKGKHIVLKRKVRARKDTNQFLLVDEGDYWVCPRSARSSLLF